MKPHILSFVLLAILGSSFAFPIQSYTITGYSDDFDYKKLVLDTANSRYYEQSFYEVQGSYFKSEYFVYPSITYRQIIINGVCNCKYQPVGYSNLVSLWNSLTLQQDFGTYSKYVGTYKEFPGCSSFQTATYTWYVNDSPSYPLNVSYPTSYGPSYTLIELQYSSTPDTSVFSPQCCTNPSSKIC